MPKKTQIDIKRIYELPSFKDGYRMLIDRLWPRGIKKADAKLDEWNKAVAPSAELREWFNHKAERFDEFASLYREELMAKEKELDRLRVIAKTQNLSLLYGAKDSKINHAIILRNILMKI